MAVFLTGATGYVGSRVLRRLLDEGEEVFALARRPEALPSHPRLTTIAGDLTRPLELPEGARAEKLVHAAASIDLEASREVLFATNVDGTRHVAEAARSLGIRRAVFISSLMAAGPLDLADPRRDESVEPAPDHPYGESKLAAERVMQEELGDRGVDLVILRPGNILGQGEPGISAILQAAVENPDWALLAQEWNQHRFQPVEVRDVVEAVLAGLDRAPPGVYNLTDSTTPTVGELFTHVRAIVSAFGGNPPAKPADFSPLPANGGRNQYVHALGRAVTAFDFEPERNFAQTCIELFEQQGRERPIGHLPVIEGPLRVLLLNTPAAGTNVNRDMNGGLGFEHNNVDRFPPLDLLWLAASLEDGGHHVEVLDGATTPHVAGDLCTHVTRQGFDVVVCEVSLPTFESDVAFLQTLRLATRARLVAKTAIHHGHFHQRLLHEAKVDFILLGECDLTIADVLRGADERGTARHLASGDTRMVAEEKLEDLDRLPLPARELVDLRLYEYELLGGRGFTTIQSSRGCPYSCGYYCPYPAAQGKAWRARSPEHVLAEIEDCVRLGLDKILFRDATFTLNRDRTVGICRGIIERGLEVSWWCETRFNCLDAELLELMAQAGCRGINFGLESGDDEVLKQGAKQGVDVQRIRSILEATERAGIVSHLLVAVGMPQETRSSIFETFKLVADLPARTLGVTPITPLPGTRLFEDAEAKGWIVSREWSRYGGKGLSMRTDNLSSEDIEFAATMIYDYFKLTRDADPDREEDRAEQLRRMQEWVQNGLDTANAGRPAARA